VPKKLSPELPPDHPDVIAARLTEMERKIDRLRSMYENHFSGAERMPPSTPRREMNRLVLEMQQIHIRNSGLKFRMQSMLQRWTLYTTYWNRTMREIEAGTYRKDIARLQRHMTERGETITEEQAIALGIPATRARTFVFEQKRRLAARQRPKGAADPAGVMATTTTTATTADDEGSFDGPATEQMPASVLPPADPPAPRVSAPPTRPLRAEPVPGMSDDAVDDLHRRYEEARRTTGDKRSLTVEQLREMLRKQVPRIMQEHMAFGIDFDVGVKEGRVVLRAKPVK